MVVGSSPIPVIKDIDRRDLPVYKASKKKKATSTFFPIAAIKNGRKLDILLLPNLAAYVWKEKFCSLN